MKHLATIPSEVKGYEVQGRSQFSHVRNVYCTVGKFIYTNGSIKDAKDDQDFRYANGVNRWYSSKTSKCSEVNAVFSFEKTYIMQVQCY